MDRNDSASELVLRDWRMLSNHEIRRECQKGPGEIFLASHFVYRPFTIYITKLYARLGTSPNTVTIHSCLAAIVAAACALYPGGWSFLLCAAGLQIYFILDHVDGELARLWLWTGRARPNAAGAFLDGWVHYHSINIVVTCLGIGLTMQTGQIVWAVVGVVAGNLLSNFTKLTLARTLLRERATLSPGPEARALTDYATDAETPLFSPNATRRDQTFQVARELFAFPGPVVILSLTLTLDAAAAFSGYSRDAAVTKLYLAFFAAAGLAAKIFGVRRIVRSLNLVGYH